MALQGPHQVAQKSVTTMREEERVWERCVGEVIVMVLDCDIVGGGCWVDRAKECVWWYCMGWRNV